MQDYVATGKYKSENISGNQFMLKEDREFFDQYGLTLERQAALIAEDYCYGQDNSLYDFIADLEEHEGEYVVNGALLTCSQGTKQTWKIKVDGVLMESVPQEVEENSRIRIEEREQSFGGLVPAGITDTLGGLRGEELLAGGGTENERELNIVSFGNCRFIAQGEELDEILKKKKLTGSKNKIIEAIKEGKGTCYCMMKLNEEWENLAIAGEYMTGQVKMPTAGIDRLMLGGSYMKFNGIEGINMLSILFCQFGGGIITALESGQNNYRNNFWTEEEMYILEHIGDSYAYENWSEEKKRCAEEIWQRFYVEAGYDVYFVVGIIGNMYGEGSCGLLQDTQRWGEYSNNEVEMERNKAIYSIQQAQIACLKTPDGMGIGMLQWSTADRKELLYGNYELFSLDGNKLSNEQLINAEIKTIKEELEGSYAYVYSRYEKLREGESLEGEKINLATNIFFRDYEAPGEYWHIEKSSYEIIEEIKNKAMQVEKEKDVSSIYKRNIAAKIAYEHFMEP